MTRNKRRVLNPRGARAGPLTASCLLRAGRNPSSKWSFDQEAFTRPEVGDAGAEGGRLGTKTSDLLFGSLVSFANLRFPPIRVRPRARGPLVLVVLTSPRFFSGSAKMSSGASIAATVEQVRASALHIRGGRSLACRSAAVSR